MCVCIRPFDGVASHPAFNIPQSAINSIIKTRNIMAQPWLYLEVKVTWQEGKDETDVAGEIHS